MPSRINTFVDKFSGGFIHPNLFRVKVAAGFLKTDLLNLSCKTAKIPGVTFTEGKYSVDGKYRKFVTGADYDPIDFVFIVDAGGAEGSEVINAFDTWGAKIFNGKEFGYKNEYKADIDVEILNRAGEVIYAVTIKDCYPTVITSFELSYETSDSIMEYTISFNYTEVEVKQRGGNLTLNSNNPTAPNLGNIA